MSVDSFGYQVMSLDELITELQAVRDRHPGLADNPVWVDNCPPLKWPVLKVGSTHDAGRQYATITVERGGN